MKKRSNFILIIGAIIRVAVCTVAVNAVWEYHYPIWFKIILICAVIYFVAIYISETRKKWE